MLIVGMCLDLIWKPVLTATDERVDDRQGGIQSYTSSRTCLTAQSLTDQTGHGLLMTWCLPILADQNPLRVPP